MRVAVICQMCGSAAPHFHLSDIFEATKLPEKKALLADSTLWKGERNIAEIVLISLETAMGELSYRKSTDTWGIKN